MVTRSKSLFIARPCGLGFEHPYCGTYMANAQFEALRESPYINRVGYVVKFQARIMASRNSIAREARTCGADYLMMVDPDMCPDVRRLLPYPEALEIPKFLVSSLEFLENHDGPAVVCAPCCGDFPGNEVLLWPDVGGKEKYSREAAAKMTGIKAVGHAATAQMLISVDAFRRIPEPWFLDIYTDKCYTECQGQDYVFSQHCWDNGVPLYCNWDCWAGHEKSTIVGKPGDPSIYERPSESTNPFHRSGEPGLPPMEEAIFHRLEGLC